MISMFSLHTDMHKNNTDSAENRAGFRFRPIDFAVLIALAAVFAVSALVAPSNRSYAGVVEEQSYDEMIPSAEEPIPVLNGYKLVINGAEIAFAETAEELEAVIENSIDSILESTFPDAEVVSAKISDDYSCEPSTGTAYDDATAVMVAIESAKLSLKVELTEVRTSEIPFTTRYIDDSTQCEGKNTVLTDGINGSLEETYIVLYTDGVKTEESLVSSKTVNEPVAKVIKRGVKLPLSAEHTNLKMFIMPYNGGITSEYGTRYLMGMTFHGGLDLAAKVAGESCWGDDIVAAGDGVVVLSQTYGDFGKLTIIEHPNGLRTYYAHQSKLLVEVGQKVRQGEVIGRIGSTGQVTGPHLHFEVRVPSKTEDGKFDRVDPKDYIIDYEKYYRD